MPNNIIIISGTTASGKSRIALELAEKINGEIINADSMQIYADIPILSAQPTEQAKKQILHYLYGFVNIDENFSVAKWLKLAERKIEDCISNNKTPILTGGTGLYIRSLINGISDIPDISDNTKKQSHKLHAQIGNEEFYNKLIELDPDSKKLQPNDTQRILRSYNVVTQTGKPLNYWHKQKTIPKYKNFKHFIIIPERELLYKNCDERFDEMLKDGLIDEIKNLLTIDPELKSQATKAIGVNEITKYLTNKISLEEAIILAKTATRQYAKRQTTWFKNQFRNQAIFLTQ